MKKQITCDFCGKEMFRYPSQIKEHNFCCHQCQWDYGNKEKNPDNYNYKDFSKNSKRFTEMNKRLNPNRMTLETRKKLRESHLNKGEGKCYEKYFGRHTHRVVAEQKLGRPLKPGEVVHHIDGNKRNNNPDNLMIFKSQKEHAKWHVEHGQFKKGGVSYEI